MASVLDLDKASLMAPRPSAQRGATGTSTGQGEAFRKTLDRSNAASQDKPADQPSSETGTAQNPKAASRREEASPSTSMAGEASGTPRKDDKTETPPANASAAPDAATTSNATGEDLPGSLQPGMIPASPTDAGEETETKVPADGHLQTDDLTEQAGAAETAALQTRRQVKPSREGKATPHPDAAMTGVKTEATPDQVKAAADQEGAQPPRAKAETLTSDRAAAHTDLPAAAPTGATEKADVQLPPAGMALASKADTNAAKESLHGGTRRSAGAILSEGGQPASDLIQKAAAGQTSAHEHDARALADPAFTVTSLAEAIDQKASSGAMLAGDVTRTLTGPEGGLQALHGQAPSIVAAPATPAMSTPPAAQAMAAAQTQATLVAAPEEIVDILSQKPSRADGRDRIMVQLDPPELGRISLDFKFDAQGLQHVTITGETPEAMRRMRIMHNELVQALEQHGLSGKDMSFQEQAQRQWNGQTSRPLSDQGVGETTDTLAASAVPLKPALTRITSSGLDIRL